MIVAENKLSLSEPLWIHMTYTYSNSLDLMAKTISQKEREIVLEELVQELKSALYFQRYFLPCDYIVYTHVTSATYVCTSSLQGNLCVYSWMT